MKKRIKRTGIDSRLPTPYTPSSKRQILQLQHSRSDKQHERDDPNHHAQNIRGVVAVAQDSTGATAVDAAVLVGLEGTREGRGDERVFQRSWVWGRRGWVARGCCEEVD